MKELIKNLKEGILQNTLTVEDARYIFCNQAKYSKELFDKYFGIFN